MHFSGENGGKGHPENQFLPIIAGNNGGDGFPVSNYCADSEFSDGDPFESISECDDEQGGEQEEEEGFASHFYRSGADWSCLLPAKNGNFSGGNERVPVDSKRKLKQANLRDMWGLTKKKIKTQPDEPKRIPLSTTAAAAAPRPCPFYKRIPGTPFVVDAFRYGLVKGCGAYFLTHFHYDHYGGLTSKWSAGPIYCTPLTARLLRLCLSLHSTLVHPLELNMEYVIQGVRVTLLEANHCPGAALIHFRLPDGRCYLHTGDFRASKLMQTYPLLLQYPLHVLYLDTTYCNPKYNFPSKEEVLSYVVRVTNNFLQRQPKTLVVVGSYTIGKECVFLAISKALGVKIYANASKRRILQSFDCPDLSGRLCTQAKDTLLHVLPISSLKFQTLEGYLKNHANQYTKILAFRPTGWTYSETIGEQLDRIRPSSKGNITIYGVPYSEHSSFTELKEFVQFLKPDKIIPTVNISNPANREKMQSHFREWLKARI